MAARHGAFIMVILLVMSFCRGSAVARGSSGGRGGDVVSEKPELNLSQVLACLAIVNVSSASENTNDEVQKGSSASENTNDETQCPANYSDVLKPIRFKSGVKVKESSIWKSDYTEALVNVLKSGTNQGLVFRLVGHSDQYGPLKAKRDVSYQRAYKLRQYLMRKGLRLNQLEVLGRSDSVPYGDIQDEFIAGNQTSQKTPESQSADGIQCKLGVEQVNCDRRVSIEVASPVVARYGGLAHNRSASYLISEASAPHVRYYPNGLVPGRTFGVDLGELLPANETLDLKWHPNCQGGKSDWVEVGDKTGGRSWFDEKAGKLYVRVRLRENVMNPQSGTTQSLLLELAATENKPKDRSVTPLPDYWAVRMRMSTPMSTDTEHKRLPLEILVNDLKTKLITKLSDGSVQDSEINAQVEKQAEASACLGILLNDSNKIKKTLIKKIGNSIPDHLAMHGDDRLAQVFGSNAWTASHNLQPGMKLCIGSPQRINVYGNNTKLYSTANPVLPCGEVLLDTEDVFSSGDDKAKNTIFNTWVSRELSANSIFEFSDDFKNICYEVVERDENGVPIKSLPITTINRTEQLGCLASFDSFAKTPIKVLFSPYPSDDNEGSTALVPIHTLVTAESTEIMKTFMQNATSELNCKLPGITCLTIDNAIAAKPSRVAVLLKGDNQHMNDTAVLPGYRLSRLVANPYTGEVDEDLLAKQLQLEFPGTAVERSSQLLVEWPITNTELLR